MSLCTGGSFGLQTESVNSKTGAKTNGSANQPCSKFWSEMKLFAFNGKAKIKVNNNKGQLTPISSQGARRFFGEYEICTAAATSPATAAPGRRRTPARLRRQGQGDGRLRQVRRPPG
jgi:hypothetical protein